MPSSSLPHQPNIGHTHEALGACLETDSIVRRIESTGLWVTSSCNLLVPSRLSWAQSHIYHFHLIMGCCCTHPILWLGWSGNSTLMMGSSSNILTWWPCCKMFSFQFQDPITGQELSLKGKRVVCRWQWSLAPKSWRPSLWATYATDTSCPNGSAGSYRPSDRAVCTAAYTCCKAKSCPRPHSKLAACIVTWYMG